MASCRFSFILVNYQSASLIRQWLLSWPMIHIGTQTFEILIANNDQDPEEIRHLDALCQEFPDFSLHIIHLPENIGFGSAVNRAANIARGDLFFLCNPDTQFLEGNLDHLSQIFDQETPPGIVGLQLLDADHQPEAFSTGRAISLWQLLRNHSPWREAMPTSECPVERVSGGALCLPQNLFMELGGFDEDFFLYFEDADLCQRTSNLGKHILFSPSVQLLHQGGASMPSKGQQKEWYHQSRALYFRKHRPRIESWILRLFSLLFEKS